MNDDEEGATEVMQESQPPLIEEHSPSETKPPTKQAQRRQQFEALGAANAALLEAEKADEGEEGRVVGDSSSLRERSGEVTVSGDVPDVKDELFVGNDGDGGDGVSLVKAAEEDGSRGVKYSVAAEIEGGGQDDDVKLGESSMAGEENENLDGRREVQTDMKQDDEANVVEGSARLGETEEVDGSQLNVDGDRQAEAEEEKEMETEHVNRGEEGREVGDSSFSVDKIREVIVGAEGSAAQVELNVENDGEGDVVLPVTVAVKEGGLVAGAVGMIPVEKHGVSKEEKMDGSRETQTDNKQNDVVKTAEVNEKISGDAEMEEVDGLFPVNLQDDKMVEDGKTEALESEITAMKESEFELKEEEVEMEVEEKKEVEEAGSQISPFGEKATEEYQGNVGSELSKEEEALKVKESFPLGEEEKLEGDCEAQTDKKQDDDACNYGGETAKAVEKMSGDREMAEEGGSQLNTDGLFPVTLQGDELVEDGKRKALGTDIKVTMESEIELKEETGEMEKVKMEGEDQKQIKMEERQGGAKEDEERLLVLEEEKQMEEDEREEARKSGSGKRKRKSTGRAPPRTMVGEDVCFICLDGGDLVLCDRRGCPKAYHPSCVDRDEAFFRSKGRWDCGWHICRQCRKKAYYMCYTCQFSLCKGCLTDDASFFCVRGSKGLCQTCLKSVVLIENNEGNEEVAAFDDKSSMDYLFKDYWTEQKEALSLTSDEIATVMNRSKRPNADHNEEILAEAHAGNTEGGAVSDSSLGTAEPTSTEILKSKKQMRSSTVEVDYDADGLEEKAEATGAKKRGRRRLKSQSEGANSNVDNSSKDDLGDVPRRKKAKKLSGAHPFEGDSASHMASTYECTPSQSSTEWASKELLEFVAHVKNGDKSALSQFDVQELLLEYVKRNKLRDPRRAGQIACDAMLQKLFGKPRVGHIEMLKLLESHFLSKEDSQGDDNQGSVLDAEISQHGNEEITDSFIDVEKTRGRKARKRAGSRGLQSNLDDYAAIDMHNIRLIYLRRNLIEALMEDRESFHEKVVGSFVRIRITGGSQKQELHRLVQVIGTKVAEPYKVGKRVADCMLEILNLNKTEVISMDTISNQDFDEDECKRLRQSIKCGFLSRLTVGDVLDKAKDLHVVRVTDWLETEITRLNHLRDRASDLGRKKECVEKLQLLNTPEERQRRLDEIPEVHADPNMDPSHESEDESESEKGRENIWRRETWREREHFPSRKGGDSPSTDPWNSAAKSPSKKWEPSRSLSGKGFSSRPGDAVVAEEPLSPIGDKMSSQSTSLEKLRTPDSLPGNKGQLSEAKANSSTSSPSETSRPLPAASLVQNEVKISETEKVWHYKDPSGKVQGPFSVVQLRKWNKSGYFPSSLRIWRTTQAENDSILLNEALAGKLEKEPTQAAAEPIGTTSKQVNAKPIETLTSQQVNRGQVIGMLKIDQNRTTDQLSPTVQRSQLDPRFPSNDSQSRIASSQSSSPASSGRTRVSRWSGSPTPVGLPSTAAAAGATPDSTRVSKSSTSPSYEQKPAFDRSQSTQHGSVYTQNPSSQPTQHTLPSVTDTATTVSTNHNSVVQPANGQNPTASAHGWVYAQIPSSQSTHLTVQSVTDTATTISTNSSNVVQPTGQIPTVSAHGWGSSGQMLNPDMQNANPNFTNTNAMYTQAQQQPVYGHWQNNPANNLPPPPPLYTAGQTSSGDQNLSGLPVQAPWMSTQVPTTTQVPGYAGWAQMQAYLNMGWVAPSGPAPVTQFGSQPGTAAGPALGMQPGNVNPAGWVPSAHPGVTGSWNWQPPQGQGMVVGPGTQIPKGQKPCPYLMQGHCKKGAACDFRHN